MKYYLHYKDNKIIGCGQCECISEEFECREVTKTEYQDFQKTLEEKQVNQTKLNELTNWFDSYFDIQLTQSQWQDDFKVSKDPYFKDENGKPRTYADIEELKAQAKLVREEIKRLRQN